MRPKSPSNSELKNVRIRLRSLLKNSRSKARDTSKKPTRFMSITGSSRREPKNLSKGLNNIRLTAAMLRRLRD